MTALGDGWLARKRTARSGLGGADVGSLWAENGGPKVRRGPA